MTIWLLTIGSNDVLLSSDKNWDHLKRKGQDSSLSRFNKPPKLLNGLHAAHARSLGMVYGHQLTEYSSDLRFPRLDVLCQQFEQSNRYPQQVIVLLTDQSAIFPDDVCRRDTNCPFWQDTCALEPLLRFYLSNRLPNTEQIYLYIRPELGQFGLDNWDGTLSLIQKLLQDVQVQEQQTVYISHQAGTPALSSAVQFVCLSKFGSLVQFLVSNEYQENAYEVINSSIYLRSLRLQEGKALLVRYDYAGLKEILAPYLSIETKNLLDAAIQWNFAKFDEFAKLLEAYSDQTFVEQVQNRSQHWWWTAYEAAYLGVVRLEQGNTVEAMFHSFRAVEGLLRQWVDEFYLEEIKQTKHPRWQENERWDRNLNLYGEDLYWFLTLKKSIDQNKDIKQNITPDIFIFGSRIFKNRNNLFHQLKGLQGKEEVFESWRSPNEKQWGDDAENKWKNRVKNCLDFISGETFEFLDKEDLDGKVASLMVKVHQKLERAVENLESGSSEI